MIANNIGTKSITLYDLHPMEGMIVDYNRNTITHWLLIYIYNTIMELYVDTSTISVNGQHVLYKCFCNSINIYKYVSIMHRKR